VSRADVEFVIHRYFADPAREMSVSAHMDRLQAALSTQKPVENDTGAGMSDRELLELAAKAAGFVIESFIFGGGAWIQTSDKPDAKGDYPVDLWNPLGNDGDALRLAIKCSSLDLRAATKSIIDAEGATGKNLLSLVRRSIVVAAAEIGKRSEACHTAGEEKE